MLRFLFYLAIAYLIWMVLGSVFRSLKGGGGRRPKQLSNEDLVQCAACQTYVPKSGVVRRKGRDFCSKECAGKFKG